MNGFSKTYQWLIAIPILFFIACQSPNKIIPPVTNEAEAPPLKKETAPAVASWPSQMQQLTYYLSELLPMMTDPKKYDDKESKKILEARMVELKRLAHNINEATPTPDQDPSLRLVGRRFEDNLKLSLESFQTGHAEFSRSVLKNALAQCVQCHTRLATGPALSKPPFANTLQQVAIVERVQFLIASRYFDDAMTEIELALRKGETLSIVAWQKLVQMGLIINIRFRNDLKKSQQFVRLLNQNTNIPFFIKRHLPFWDDSIKEWARSPKATPNLKTIQQIVTRAETAQKASRSDGGTIDYLRASSLLHQFLAKNQVPSAQSEALYQLGLIYENVGEIGAWSMNEDYYETCIRTQPHSETAKKCFARFQESTISGFSGTGGLHIPEDVQTKMNELRAVAL